MTLEHSLYSAEGTRWAFVYTEEETVEDIIAALREKWAAAKSPEPVETLRGEPVYEKTGPYRDPVDTPTSYGPSPEPVNVGTTKDPLDIIEVAKKHGIKTITITLGDEY